MSAYSALILAETGLAHYWRLDEASGTSAADSAPGSSITAGYSNTPTLGAAGLLTGDADTAISCNGVNQFVDMHNASAVRAGNLPYTWEAWVNPSNASGAFLRILGADDGSGNGPTLLYDGPSNTFRKWRTTSANQISWKGTGTNTRCHVVVTYDGRTTRCYLNAEGRGGIIDTTSIATMATTFNIGSTGALNAFQAQIGSSRYAVGAPLAFTAPALTGVSPTSKSRGSAFTLTCTGTDFTYDSVVYWGTTALVTTFVSSTTLTAMVTGTQTASAGTFVVTVRTPGETATGSATVRVTTLTSVFILTRSGEPVHVAFPDGGHQ